MSIKKMILLLATGFSTGVVMIAAINQFGRTAIGGELFFVPMVGLLVWFGWMIRGEYSKSRNVRRWKSDNTRRK
ncbi:MAG: hypothetical protein MR885_04240 [Ruminococcus bromii]|nr:hypothetical protein [Ruminococcus bromii]